MEVINFKDLKLSDEVERALDDMGFEEATPIQIQSIPYILENRDVLGQAQTGTGKTCAFGIPAIEKINLDQDDIQVLVLCPTRELAIQSAKELKNVAKYKNEVRILPIYGGQPIERQIVSLKKHPQIIIGTPGRVMDHIRRHTIKFTNLKMIILDEADEMLNMGFREDIDTILTKAPEQIQTILFSATMSRDILEITGKYQKDPVKIKITHKVLTVPSVEQYSLEVNPNNKLEVLSRLIDVNNIKLGLVFCNTKRQVDELASSLQARGYSAEALHGDMRQESRDKVMAQFRKGNIEILIATDVAARGIDVNNVEAVFNYDLPNDEEYYVHRIGRTGRAGKTGKAFTFVSGREIIKLKDIQRFTKSSITPIKPPSVIDFKERRMRAIMDLTKQTILAGKHVGYTRYIEKMIEDFNIESEDNSFASTIDIAAALLKEYLEKINSTSLNMNKISEKPNITKGGFRGKRTDVKKRSRNYYKKH